MLFRGLKTKKDVIVDRSISPSLLALYVDTLVMAIGFYMLVPILSVYFINHLGMSTALAGSIIAVSGLAQNGLRFFCGIAADRIGYKETIMLGVGVRIVGFTLYGIVDHPAGYAVAAFISGMGGAIFHPASFGAYARTASEEMKTRIFSIRETLSNVGFILGPVIGMLLLRLDFSYVCFSSAFMFALAFLLSWILLPKMEGERSKLQKLFPIVKKICKDKSFLGFCLLIIGVWALNVQLYLSVPVRAKVLHENVDSVSFLYMAGAVFMVLLQIPLLRILSTKLHQLHIMALGTFILGLSMLIFSITGGLWSMLGTVLIFTLGQMLVVPTMNFLISNYSDSHSFATYFGFTGWSFALGGFLGNTGGGYLHDLAINSEYSLVPWITLFLFGSFISIIFYRKGNARLHGKLEVESKTVIENEG
ncbi:MFS transporter [Neobacillus sp. DY30]|uniref:MFS transporter n=1 Tax=Neobacillus sp. DY30 TaxID=3047871 RepID=UPI0024BF9B08|nr:MFS transporter [Neobacillus sp. DY30]WHY02470.1 MFS transporter [Neobacillus sp. DY30]